MKRQYLLPLFLLLQIILLNIVSFFPESVEKYYSNLFYPLLSDNLRFLISKIPFSVGDCVYFTLIVLGLYWLVKQILSRQNNWKTITLEVLSAFSVFYALFNLFWGMNYYRQPLFEKMKLQKDYSVTNLEHFTEKLIIKTNAIHLQITKDSAQAVKSPYDKKQIFDRTYNGYNHLAKEYPYFTFQNPNIKKSLFSLPLTYMGFGGYLNPFFNEAHVNDKLPMYSFPTVVCHEMAHQIGYASESEANFIAFLSAKKNPDLYFQYSAHTLALQYCLRNLKIQNNDKDPVEFLKKINPGIRKNFAESKAFWESYETPIETVFEFIYDKFLKLNQQKDGMESYSKFVDLMVNYYKTRRL